VKRQVARPLFSVSPTSRRREATFVTGEVLRVDGGFTTHDPGYALGPAP
jgi:hypothetical protein